MTVFFALLLSFFSSHAQNQKTIDGQTMNINYGSTSWNTDSRKIDSAYLVMKDKSGRMVQIQLEESEPDSAQFKGKFNVNFTDPNPKVFIPPKELRNPERDYKKVHEMINNGRLTSKPFVWKKNDKGQMLVDVYDTQEQADAVRNAYETEQRLKAEAHKQRLLKEAQAKEAAAQAAAAAHKAAMEQLAIEAAQREADRLRLEQLEKQRAEERERQARMLTEQQKALRRAKAKELAEEAMVLFNKGEFDAAEPKFKQSIELDPENKTYYFQYGVTLYKNEKFNDALVILKISEVPPAMEMEKAYFTGLVHYRLKEYKPAKENFAKASASTDSTIGPSSNFYRGLIQFSEEEYKEAKQSFETVLDTSKDPRMDQQAEEYIERILQAMQFKKMQEKRWSATGTVGLSYDSNVILSPDTASTEATDKADARLHTSGELAYRAIYNPTHEWTLKFAPNLTNSAKNQVARADPWLVGFGSPYTYKTTAWGKGYVFSAKPTYEMLYMDPNGTGTKSQIMRSIYVTFDNMFVMKPNHIAIYSLDVRNDDFNLADSTGDNDYDAMRYTLKTTQMVFLDKSKKEAVVGNLGFGLNDAKGKNKDYQRIEFGATYLRPMKWGYSWTFGLSAFNLSYNNSDDGRKDFNVTLSTGIDKPIRDWVSWNVTAAYTKNDSSEESTYEYSKWLIMTSATFTSIF